MSRYEGKIKVVGADFMCFPVDPKTLEPLATSVYDPYAFADPEVGPIELIDTDELHRRRYRRM